MIRVYFSGNPDTYDQERDDAYLEADRIEAENDAADALRDQRAAEHERGLDCA